MSAVHELRVSHGKPGRPSRPQGGAAAKTARGRETGIAVFGLFGCGNLGNDGSLESMLLFLREKRPDVRLFCICKVPEVVTENFGIETIPIRLPKSEGIARFLDRIFLKFPGMVMNFIHALRHIRKAGVMVVPGTGILDDFGDRPTGLPFDVFKWCLASRLMGTRIAFVSIGAGPIGNRLSRWLMTSAARMADYRSYRDTGSREFMESVGVDTSLDSMYPDLAFKLKVPQSAPADPLHPLTVGVGVMNYRGWYAFDERGQGVFEGYVAKMAKFVTRLLASGYNVHLLTGDEDDATAVEAVKAALGEADTERLSSEPVHSLHDVFSQVARTDLVVARDFAELCGQKRSAAGKDGPWRLLPACRQLRCRSSGRAVLQTGGKPGRTFPHDRLQGGEIQKESRTPRRILALDGSLRFLLKVESRPSEGGRRTPSLAQRGNPISDWRSRPFIHECVASPRRPFPGPDFHSRRGAR
jgi:polysaccharide pyruvyl transferase WcaK-like protein